MKASILLLLAAVALSKGARLTWSDCLDKETVNILVPHENCHKFYQCDDGKLITRICPAKLMFNIEDQRCDWPDDVDCQNRGIPDSSDEEEAESGTGGGHNDPSEAPAICAAEESDGTLIAHEYCNKYYICSDGAPVAMSCPRDLFFNADIDQCDWPENVKCDREVATLPQPDASDEESDEVVIPEPEPEPQPEPEPENSESNESEGPIGSGNDDPSQAEAICAAEESDDILISNEYCNKFYICSEGKPVAMFCPEGLIFNANKDQCDWPKNVGCDREIAPLPQPEEDGDNESEVVDPEPEPQPEPEPEPQPESEQETDNGDGDDEPVGAGNNNPSEAPEICAAEESDGILIANEYCNKFYICSEGKPVAMFCPKGLIFNANKDQCDWPKNVECDREIAPLPKPEENGDNESEVVDPKPEPQPEPEPEPQPEPQPETEQEPDNGDGDDEPVGAGNNDPSEAPEICAAEESDGILIANEYCNKFYICSEGKPVAMFCPKGLIFNANKDQCDWPKNVECDREIAPLPKPEEDGDNESEVVDPKPEPQPEPEPEPQPEPQPETEQEPDNGDGDDEPVGAGNNDPSEAPEICAAEESDGILIANEYCNKFYICSEGKPVAMFCPKGLIFNANKDQCDWPKNVECDREIAPLPKPEEDGDNESEVVDPKPEPQPEPEPEPQPEPQPETEQEPDNGDGDDEPVGAGNNDPSEAPEICAAEESDGILIANEYCNKFYICSEGKPVAMFCPKGLIFNANKDQCDWPKNVECDREIAPLPKPEEDGDNESEVVDPKPEPQPEPEPEPQPEPQPETEQEPDNGDGDDEPVGAGNNDPSEAPEICAAEESDGILIANEYCNKFYICSEGKPVAMFCPKGLIFNANKDQCDWPKNVECDREIAPLPKPEENGDNESEVVDPKPEPQPEPEPEPQPEPEPDNGDGDDEPVGAGNNDPSEAPEICAAKESDGILIANEYCNKFYVCSEGKPVPMFCPKGLIFNANKDQCDWPKNVECDREIAPLPQPEEDGDNGSEVEEPEPEPQPKPEPEPQPEPEPEPDNGDGDDEPVGAGNNDPSEAPEICAAKESDGILIANEYCNKFYVCSEGKPVPMFCPKGLIFNANKDQCDWPKNVECDREIAPLPKPEEDGDNGSEVEEPEPEPQPEPEPEPQPEPESEPDNGDSDDEPVGAGNNDPSEALEICAVEESDGILIANEYCNKFYVCSEGKPVAMFCPEGLIFNANKDQCDWPKNVECDREIASVPQPEEDGDNGSEVVGPEPETQPEPEPEPQPEPEPEPQPEPEPEPDNGDGNDEPVGAGNNDPSEALEICAAEESDGILIANEYCNKFYVCSEGKPVALFCPEGLIFNANKDQCDWPNNVECDREIAPVPQPEEDGDNDSEVVEPEPEPQPEPQPELQPEPDNGDNDVKPVGAGNNDPSAALKICAAEDSDGILIANEYCNKFYVCSEGKPVALFCPVGLIFNANKDQCDWPKNVECDGEIAPLPQPEESDDNDSEIVEPEQETQPEPVPEPDNDNIVVAPLPEPESQPDNEEEDTLIGGGNSDPTQADSLCAADESDGVLVAHENCSKFYICNQGKPVILVCPKTLLFNPNIDRCDWPEKVECGDRAIPVRFRY